MSEEERDLLARIGQLAGQINRHKSQSASQSGPTYPTNRYRGALLSSRPSPGHDGLHCRDGITRHDGINLGTKGNAYRQASAPYPGRGFRGGRPPAAMHRNRTLHLRNTSPSGSNPGSPAASPSLPSVTPGWISKHDRHRQLINANVYEKEVQSRSKAMEETRQRKLKERRRQEKTRFNDFLRRQAVQAGGEGADSHVPPGPKEIAVNGVRFLVMDGGKKLVKAADDRNSLCMTPKSTVIAGIRFHRTKTGNLVAARIVKDHRQSGVKKIDQACKIFSTTGSCPKGPACRYLHDPNKTALCKNILKDGRCGNGESCDLSHEPSPERVPNCVHHAKGHCTKPDCLYTHSKASQSAPVCEAFGFCGYCERGADCSERHVFECPDFSNTGVCKTRGCKLLHRERASLLRNQMRQDEGGGEEEDVSSDDDSADSDDVDSDEVAEMMEESDSEVEDQSFIPL